MTVVEERVGVVAAVPGAADMDDDTFWKHINARHLQDFGKEAKPFGTSPLWNETIILSYRAFHKRVHELEVPGTYNHEHVGEN